MYESAVFRFYALSHGIEGRRAVYCSADTFLHFYVEGDGMTLQLMKVCFIGIMEVIAIGIIGALIIGGVKRSDEFMGVMSNLFVKITLPCLVFSNMATRFDTGGLPYWWLFPLLGIALFAAGGLLGYCYSRIDRSVQYPGVFSASITFHNSILLPLAFAPVLFEGEQLSMFLNLLFLYNILTIPSFFTFGMWMVHTSTKRRFRPLDVFNPPNVATVLGLIFVFAGWNRFLPGRLIDQLTLFGSLSSPLSILIVGGTIVAGFSSVSLGDLKTPLKIMILKSFVLPILAAIVVYLTRPSEYIALFIVLGSVMPVGSIIAVIIPPEKDVRNMVAGGILLSNLASIVVVPVFFSFFGLLYGWG